MQGSPQFLSLLEVVGTSAQNRRVGELGVHNPSSSNPRSLELGFLGTPGQDLQSRFLNSSNWGVRVSPALQGRAGLMSRTPGSSRRGRWALGYLGSSSLDAGACVSGSLRTRYRDSGSRNPRLWTPQIPGWVAQGSGSGGGSGGATSAAGMSGPSCGAGGGRLGLPLPPTARAHILFPPAGGRGRLPATQPAKG